MMTLLSESAGLLAAVVYILYLFHFLLLYIQEIQVELLQGLKYVAWEQSNLTLLGLMRTKSQQER